MQIPFARTLVAAGLCSVVCSPSNADVWKWIDPLGRTHFVDTMKPIFTWLDDSGKVHFSDKPEDQDAIAVQLIWHSKGSLDEVTDTDRPGSKDGSAYPDDTPEEREERRTAEAYYCKRATEIYETYLNAPDLYRSDENGERVYLTKKEMAQTIAETKARRDELCN